jgi:uncharacterized protein (TIGR02246 family)
MKQVLVAIGLSTLTLSAAFAQTAAPAPVPAMSKAMAEARAGIDKGNAQWSEGWKKGDADMVAAIFAPDGVQLAGNGRVVKGRPAIRDRQKTAMAGVDPGTIVTVTTVNVWMDGDDTAYETGKYRYEYKEKGKPGMEEGRYVTIWKRQHDGSWKLTMDMGVPQ